MAELVAAEPLEDKIGAVHLLGRFGTDTDADAAVAFGNVLRHGFDAVVTGCPAPDAHPHLAEGYVELVVYDDGFFELDFIKITDGLDSFATEIHECCWFDDYDSGVAHLAGGYNAFQVLFLDPWRHLAGCFDEGVDAGKADVVARLVVLSTGVAEADDE